MSGRPKGWALQGVSWLDVWAWARDLQEEYGYWTVVKVVPPLPSQEKVAFHVVVECKKLGGQTGHEHIITRSLAIGVAAKTSPEDVALQMVSGIYQAVDRARYEAERAAGQGTLPF